MRKAAVIAAALVVGLIGGLASALTFTGLLSERIRLGDSVVIDGWYSNWSIGTPVLDPYTKAWVARYGLFALRRDEAVYFNTRQDVDGRSFKEDCTYAISIEDQPGEWWSLTVYNAEGFLPRNADDHLSFDAMKAEELQTREVVLSASKPTGEKIGWISTSGAGNFDLTFRVYLPTPEAIKAPAAHFQLPEVTRVSCVGGSRP